LRRDPQALADTVSDLVVIGGGIYGAAIAREAAFRGLAVALVERGDFGAATSANSHKIIHGGLRYLQHLDLPRLRESLRERTTLERIAPHLVHPLPVVIPTFGHGLRGKEILSLGVSLYGLLRLAMREPPPGVVEGIPAGPISRERLIELLPGLADSDATGGVVFYDSQVYDSERLLFAYLRSAVDAGARIANYVEATGFLRARDEPRTVSGVVAEDAFDGTRYEIRARAVVNAAGPWVGAVLARAGSRWRGGGLVRAMNVVTRQLFGRVAAGLYGRAPHRDRDAVLSRGQRLYFFVPWREHTIIGTDNAPFEGDPSRLVVTRAEIEAFLAEANAAYPSARLSPADVRLVYAGLQPRADTRGDVEIAKHYRIADHAADGLPGLFSVAGVKYTTARDVAEKLVDRLCAASGRSKSRSRSATEVLPGGEVGRFEDYVSAAIARHRELPAADVERLVRTHGSGYGDVLALLSPGERREPFAVARAEARHAVREEMAMKLADVVLRRTQIGAAEHPGQDVLEAIADVMTTELAWTEGRRTREIGEVEARYQIAG
jgi:glycerol-3-phosphate dehydrogenase